MHRTNAIDELGGDAAGYRRRFTLRYRKNHPLEEGQYPIERLLAGETIDDVTVEVSPFDLTTSVGAAVCGVLSGLGSMLGGLGRTAATTVTTAAPVLANVDNPFQPSSSRSDL